MSNFFTYARHFLFVLAFALITTAALALPPGALEFLKYEQQYVNRAIDVSRIKALTNYQARDYSPEQRKVFEVKSYWIPESQVHVFEISPEMQKLGIQFKRQLNGKTEILMLVHPESEDFFKELTRNAAQGPKFFATATASSRTLMMWLATNPEQVFFGKLSLAKEIGGVVRTLPAGEVARSIGTSEILNAAASTLPANFMALPEIFGVMPKGMTRGGMILRALPPQIASGEVRVMPLFAIYTQPHPQTPSPIQTMIERSGMDAHDFILKRILQPFVSQWIELAVEQGIVIEAHAQNVLMQIDAHGLPTGTFVYRDFGGFNIDLAFRRQHHLPMPATLPVVENEFSDYHQAFHKQALLQSLNNYFAGGFLFGLSMELVRLGYPSLSYEHLKNELQTQISLELSKRGGHIQESTSGYFKDDLLKAIDAARVNHAAAPQCGAVFLSP